MELEITETDPGFRGDTATNVTKPATLETGAEIKVPLFINPGDKIKIDTRTGEYLERCKADLRLNPVSFGRAGTGGIQPGWSLLYGIRSCRSETKFRVKFFVPLSCRKAGRNAVC